MAKEISNSDDIIDSRAVIARIAELESELEDAHHDEFEDAPSGPALDDWIREIADHGHLVYSPEALELLTLRALASEAEGYAPDWRHGVTLIRYSYFKDYARELAEDIGAIQNDAQWPATCIDWERAARELGMDYTVADFDGVTYYVR